MPQLAPPAKQLLWRSVYAVTSVDAISTRP